MMIHQLMIASILMVGIVRGTSIGAPHTCCEEMVPGHGVPAQNGTSSFLTIPHLTTIPADGSVLLTITTRDPAIKFKGFLVVASMNGMTEHIVGTFGKPSDGQILNCQLKNNETIASSAVTHKNNLPKREVTVEWFPNGFSGEVIFRTSFVLNGTTFWVAEASPAIVKVEAPPIVDGAMGFSAQPSVLMATLVFLLCAVLIR